MNEENWLPQGITKEFDTNMHLIWIIEENIEDIEIPEGYHPVKVDDIKNKRKKYVRMFLVNDVPVEAELYKNKKTKEVSYYFAGTPITLEKGKAITKIR
ncbi:MAG: hypothetical protein IKJ43_04020 [Bacilli bacterium]|nr:hypothetical protein [Bacilli bacterium]